MDSEIYTIGWVCAIEEEFVAARRMLDEVFEGPDTSDFKGNNTYAFGRINEHNVAIGCLLSGEYGAHSAAAVAKDMIWVFPNLRLVFMVGIGGGAPTKDKDIRLGDVVVSMPQDQHGGVVQYDYLKKLGGGQIGALSPPPKMIRAGLVKMKRLHDDARRPDTLADHMRRMHDEPEYQRPSEDRLYRADCHHANDGETCDGCGTDGLVERAERRADRRVIVHYGNIACAHKVMKDTSARDAYSGDPELKALCFDTEAAGLMHNLPSLLIRGICDYSDSHQNNDWHRYAALTAAAYTRDLLHIIKPAAIDGMAPIKNTVKARSEVQSEVSSYTRRKLDQMLNRRLTLVDDAMLEWITQVNYSFVHNYHAGRRQPGTGTWLSKTTEFQNWQQDGNATLFCTGIAGAGKTVLSSFVIDHLKEEFRDDSSVGIAYVYCNFNKKSEQQVDQLFSSLLKQLARQRTSLPEAIKSIYQHHKSDGTRPSWEEIWSALQDTAKLFSRVFIVVDALDELEIDNGTWSKFISKLLEFQDIIGANIFATSRAISEITKKFARRPHLEIRTHDEDMRAYLEDRIMNSNSEILEAHGAKLTDKIIEIADGIFLLARLLFDLIETNNADSITDFEETLERLPAGSKVYEFAYSETLKRIERQDDEPRHLAHRVLSWVIHAKRPLKTRELQYALAAKPGQPRPNKTEIHDAEHLVSVCAGLVTIEEESTLIRLVHDTAKQYFDEMSAPYFPEAERIISRTCTQYISDTISDYKKCRYDPSVDEFWRLLDLNPLFDYAVRYWGLHTSSSSPVPPEVVQFVRSEKLRSFAAMAIIISRATDYTWKVSFEVPDKITLQHLAAFYGVTKELRTSCKISKRLSVKDTWGRTPLLYAVMGKHENEATFLLDAERHSFRGVIRSWFNLPPKSLNRADRRGTTPLTLAASTGDEAMVRQLLARKGIRVDCQDNNGQTPLINASRAGHEGIVQLLLATNKPNINFQDDFGRTSLLFAAGFGHDGIARALLATNKVKLDLHDDDGNTPLISSARGGHEEIVKLLLATNKVDLDRQDHSGNTPLSYATANGHKGVVDLLLATNKFDSPCSTP